MRNVACRLPLRGWTVALKGLVWLCAQVVTPLQLLGYMMAIFFFGMYSYFKSQVRTLRSNPSVA
jgi:hypothetical protein